MKHLLPGTWFDAAARPDEARRYLTIRFAPGRYKACFRVDNCNPTAKLILALQEFGKRFPGFEREVHGIEVDADGDYWVRAIIDSAGDSAGNSSITIRATGQRKKPPTSAPPVKKRRPRNEKPRHAASHPGGPASN